MTEFREYKYKCRCGKEYKSIRYRSSYTGEILPTHSCCPSCVDSLCGGLLMKGLITQESYNKAMKERK